MTKEVIFRRLILLLTEKKTKVNECETVTLKMEKDNGLSKEGKTLKK